MSRHLTRIMFIECKSEAGLAGGPRFGRVTFSKSGRSLQYDGRSFMKSSHGFASNYVEEETLAEYWISGCKKDGGDTLSGGMIEIDDDAREEYWTEVRGEPDRINESRIRCVGKKR